jgi:hypothetical protein
LQFPFRSLWQFNTRIANVCASGLLAPFGWLNFGDFPPNGRNSGQFIGEVDFVAKCARGSVCGQIRAWVWNSRVFNPVVGLSPVLEVELLEQYARARERCLGLAGRDWDVSVIAIQLPIPHSGTMAEFP